MSEHPDREIDLTAIWLWLWGKKFLIAAFAISGCALSLAWSYQVDEQFTARSTLISQAGTDKTSLLSKLTAVGGLTGTGTDVPEILYGHVLRSDRVLDKVLEQLWAVGPDSLEGTLHAFFTDQISTGTQMAPNFMETQRLKNRLRKQIIGFEADPTNGFMAVTVTMPREPKLASDLANFLVSELDLYLRSVRSAKAREQRFFVTERLELTHRQLEQSETDVMHFLQENRSIADSPPMQRRLGELEREVQANRTVWVALRSQLETARIDEHRQMTSVRILDKATPPIRRSSPNRLLHLFAGATLGLLVGLLFAIVRTRHITAAV